MDIDPLVAVAGLLVGFTVGLTGMGGGALMTPILVLLFRVDPLAAVSSDLVASMVMKPIGGTVHFRRGTVQKDLVRWLVVGSVPSAFLGVLVLRALGEGEEFDQTLKVLLGVTLLVATAAMAGKAWLQARRVRRELLPEGESGTARGVDVEVGALSSGLAIGPGGEGGRPGAGSADVHSSVGVLGKRAEPLDPVRVRPLLTLLVGALGGVVVGMTSVGSGSLIIIALMLAYPTLSSRVLVGTDLVQAVPLVASAAIAHLLFGDFRLDLTASVLLGSVPGVYLGSKVSSRARDGLIRPALVLVLLASGLKLVGVSTAVLGLVVLAFALAALPLWGVIDASRRPGHHWATAGYSKRLWIGVQALGAPFGFGLVSALVYLLKTRRRLSRAGAVTDVAVTGDEVEP